MVVAVSPTRAERAAALERWADRVEAGELRSADTAALRAIADLVVQRDRVDDELTAAVRRAREAGRPWSEIGAMLGVSKQAAQRKYGARIRS